MARLKGLLLLVCGVLVLIGGGQAAAIEKKLVLFSEIWKENYDHSKNVFRVRTAENQVLVITDGEYVLDGAGLDIAASHIRIEGEPIIKSFDLETAAEQSKIPSIPADFPEIGRAPNGANGRDGLTGKDGLKGESGIPGRNASPITIVAWNVTGSSKMRIFNGGQGGGMGGKGGRGGYGGRGQDGGHCEETLLGCRKTAGRGGNGGTGGSGGPGGTGGQGGNGGVVVVSNTLKEFLKLNTAGGMGGMGGAPGEPGSGGPRGSRGTIGHFVCNFRVPPEAKPGAAGKPGTVQGERGNTGVVGSVVWRSLEDAAGIGE